MKKFLLTHYKLCVFVFFLIIFMPAASVAVFNFWKIYGMEKIDAEEKSMLLVRSIVIQQEQVINETREFLSFLSYLPQLQNPQSPNCDDDLAKLLAQHKEYTNIAVFRADGNLVCSGLGVSQSINVAYRTYFQEMLEERSFVAGGGFI